MFGDEPLQVLAVDAVLKTGVVFTVPLAALFCVVAPVAAKETLPDGVPVEPDAIRAYILVLLTLPLVGVNETELP